MVRKSRLALGLIASAAVAGVGWVATQKGLPAAPPARPADSSGVPATLVEALRVEARPVRAQIALTGQVEPLRVATVSSEVAGRLLLRPIRMGGRVAQNGLVASLDAAAAAAALDGAVAAHAEVVAARQQAEDDYARAVVETEAGRTQARAQLMQSRANARKTRAFTRVQELRQAQDALTQARAEERLAQSDIARYRPLLRQEAITPQQFDRAQAAFDTASSRRQSAEQAVSLAREGARQEDITAADAQVAVAAAGVEVADTRPMRLAGLRRQIEGLRAREAQTAAGTAQARIDLGKHQIRAPFSGRVLATQAEVGDLLAPATPVARIGDIRCVKATFAVPEASRPALRLGQGITLTADAVPGRTFTGRITGLGYQADPRSRTFTVEVTVANPQEALLPNMIIRLHLTVGPAAFHTLIPINAVATDENSAYVYVLGPGVARRRDVALGAPSGAWVAVARGLKPGELIASTPQRLQDGDPVRVAPPAGQGPE